MDEAEAIIWKTLDVRNEVQALGLEFAGLVDCVRYAERERSFVTANDAVGFQSTVVYDKAGRALRESFLGPDWIKDDSNNQCAIKNVKLKIRVVPCNFNRGAGDRFSKNVSNKSPKGEISRKKSACNMTAWLPGFETESSDTLNNDGFQTWLLGIFTDDFEPTTAELSLPITFEGSHFTKFGKRIMLITREDGDSGNRLKGTDDGNDAVEVVDIPIRRK
jgi:hypothetical protein